MKEIRARIAGRYEARSLTRVSGRALLRSLGVLFALALILTPDIALDREQTRTTEPKSFFVGSDVASNGPGTSCDTTLVSASESQPVGTGPCPGVRPGAIVRSESGSCTFNFLFRGSDGIRYMGTAGHCILNSDGEISYRPGKGPVASDAEGKRIGEFAYAILRKPKDFALVRLDPNVKARPKMCHFGGPTGMNKDTTSERVLLHYYGNGIGIGNLQVVYQPVLPARSALARNLEDPDQVFATGAAIFGDSGGGVISEDGRAVGALVAIGSFEGAIVITRLAPQLRRAERALDISLELRRAAKES